MKSTTSPVFSESSNPKKRLYDIMDGLQVEVTITSNPYQLDPDHLFQMAARINKKRSFLFVSKLLGKHIPVHPALSLASGAVLGCLYEALVLGRPTPVPIDELQRAFADTDHANKLYERMMAAKIKVEQQTLFIGFAETATALGHSMFDAFEGNVAFLHTTREQIDGIESLINFDEEHSHAVSHRCYAEDCSIFSEAARIVLVDDEMTTGKTSLNIINELYERFGQREFVVASLLDWRSDADRDRYSMLEKELGIKIRCLSLLEGTILVKGSLQASLEGVNSRTMDHTIELKSISIASYFTHVVNSRDSRVEQPKEASVPYLKYTGRFGINHTQSNALHTEMAQASEFLAKQRTGKRTLCLGTGEFMYIPMVIASLMGEGVKYQSTTRSPIYATVRDQYAVTSAYRFDSLEDAAVDNFMYNIAPGQYDEVFVFFERELEPMNRVSFERAIHQLGIPHVFFVYCS
jgi:hypothetical protein